MILRLSDLQMNSPHPPNHPLQSICNSKGHAILLQCIMPELLQRSRQGGEGHEDDTRKARACVWPRPEGLSRARMEVRLGGLLLSLCRTHDGRLGLESECPLVTFDPSQWSKGVHLCDWTCLASAAYVLTLFTRGRLMLLCACVLSGRGCCR